jgi:hypothetical protein
MQIGYEMNTETKFEKLSAPTSNIEITIHENLGTEIQMDLTAKIQNKNWAYCWYKCFDHRL